MRNIDYVAVREMYLYIEGTRPFMDRLSELTLAKLHWNTKLKIVRELVRDAIGQYSRDYCTPNTKWFSDEDRKELINTIARDCGILKEVC